MRPQVKTTILLSALALSLALNLSLAIGLLRGDGDRAGRAEGSFCLLDRLDLDPAQLERLEEMRREMAAKRAAYWKRADAIKSELAGAICGRPNRKAIDARLARYAENQADMQRAVVDHLRGVNAMLRPDQRIAFRALLRSEMFRGIRALPETGAAPP
ncbi:MAG: periplasmic heavy metal sensor [Deltaproteobacteria bacterium]|nr:periplasmic heavy metal sensor [Deltaproteobacteria bacterium]